MAYLLVLTLIFLCAAEIIVRYQGFEPWHKPDSSIEVRPGGRFFTKHATLGYTHIPGAFTVVLKDGFSFKTTHLPNTLRITHPSDTYETAHAKDEIWIFGGSFTHGWSLNDHETYPWLLQERFPQYEVVNFGVGGYGTIHSLIQLRERLEASPLPRAIVLAYGSFHDFRNTFVRLRRKVVAPHNSLGPLVQPFARFRQDGTLTYSLADVEYREFPLMRHSALMHFIEEKYNAFEAEQSRSRDVSKALIAQVADLAKKHEIEFVLAGILNDQPTQDMLDFFHGQGMNVVDISVDLSVPLHTNRPHDGHPSALANKEYADKLEVFLREVMLR